MIRWNILNYAGKMLFSILIVLFSLVVLSFMLLFFTDFGFLESFRIIFGSVYVLFLPGFILSFLFFMKDKIDFLERVALSFALSIAIVPLVIFYLNLIGIKINALNSFFSILGIIILSIIAIYWKYNKRSYM